MRCAGIVCQSKIRVFPHFWPLQEVLSLKSAYEANSSESPCLSDDGCCPQTRYSLLRKGSRRRFKSLEYKSRGSHTRPVSRTPRTFPDNRPIIFHPSDPQFFTIMIPVYKKQKPRFHCFVIITAPYHFWAPATIWRQLIQLIIGILTHLSGVYTQHLHNRDYKTSPLLTATCRELQERINTCSWTSTAQRSDGGCHLDAWNKQGIFRFSFEETT